MSDKKSAKAGFLGALVGAIAGVVAGVFALAPKGAKENREDAKQAVKDVKNDAQDKLQDAQDELEKYGLELKMKAKELKGKAKTELNDLSKKTDKLRDDAKKAVDNNDVDAADSLEEAAKILIKTIREKL